MMTDRAVGAGDCLRTTVGPAIVRGSGAATGTGAGAAGVAGAAGAGTLLATGAGGEFGRTLYLTWVGLTFPVHHRQPCSISWLQRLSSRLA